MKQFHDWFTESTNELAGGDKPVRSNTLKPEYQDMADEFEAIFEDEGCACFQAAPCSWCTHEGNPQNLMENDDAWE